MIKKKDQQTIHLFGGFAVLIASNEDDSIMNLQMNKNNESLPEKLGKAIRLPVPDFSDPDRKLTCLEVDFPIAQINALSNLEGNAGKPIYQMSKWWARRRSSVFRSMLIAAATRAPDDHSEAAKTVWEHYYCNHKKAGSFKRLRVLDCFMGGGTTLVEGSRLGMQMTGVDLNPVAWFVVKNELACSDPAQMRSLFDYIESEVKPQVEPFYVTTCPRGHKGRWVNLQTGQAEEVDPLDLPPEARVHYRWEGPEVIYTFWAKHGHCLAKGCGHRTPIFDTPVVAEKKLTTSYIEVACPNCGRIFHSELGETRMAPGSQRIILEGESLFQEMTQTFAQLLKEYDKGKADDTLKRIVRLQELARNERGLLCPHCGGYAGKKFSDVLERHTKPGTRASERKKKAFGIRTKKVQMYLLIHPEWLKGASGFDGNTELGGWAGADAADTAEWFACRLENISLIEVRGSVLPKQIELNDGVVIYTDRGTVDGEAQFTCAHCGRPQDRLASAKAIQHSAPIAAYAMQCYCGQCMMEGYNYGGRYFKIPDSPDIKRVNLAEIEWESRRDTDLKEYWPRGEILHSMRTHVKDPLPGHGYNHWWMLFSSRQLLVHAQLLKTITEASEDSWALDVREQALGVFQQYLRNQNLFLIWNRQGDKLEPMFANANYNPKMRIVENCVFNTLGRGNWQSSKSKVTEAMSWAREPWELVIADVGQGQAGNTKSEKGFPGDSLVPGHDIFCCSSTDLSFLRGQEFDLIITDPPFGNNLYYADLADFFYVWMRIPLSRWYAGLTEQEHFLLPRTPHTMEAVNNWVEHPDDREEYEKSCIVLAKHLGKIRELTGDHNLYEKDSNPLYRPEPSSDFYCKTLAACWSEAGHLLKDGGIMAFTFHHSADEAWIDVLKALFDAGYVLVATYPVRSDESKGEKAEFGSKKIEYDIIHVCRKRLSDPEPISWARMRRWVKSEVTRLKELLEHTHGKDLPESDLRVMLCGKSLEFYSRHYGKVFTGDGQILEVRDALLGINQLLDDLLEDTTQISGLRPPDIAEPISRLYLRIFSNHPEMPRDELHKTLRGTGIAQGDLEAKGWIRVVGRVIHVVPIRERFVFFTERGRTRKIIKNDLDQAHFLIGSALPESGIKIDIELNNPNLRIKKSVDEILKWYGAVSDDFLTKQAAATAAQLVEKWRTRKNRPDEVQMTFFELLEKDD